MGGLQILAQGGNVNILLSPLQRYNHETQRRFRLPAYRRYQHEHELEGCSIRTVPFGVRSSIWQIARERRKMCVGKIEVAEEV